MNHSIEFVNPTTGVHTRNVESYWNRQKTKLKRMKGVVFDEISSYLDEFMWRERWGKTSRASFDNICAHIQGVVTYTSPVEAFATGIKNLDR